MRYLLVVCAMAISSQAFAASVNLLSLSTQPEADATQVVLHFSAPLNSAPEIVQKAGHVLQFSFANTNLALGNSPSTLNVNSANVTSVSAISMDSGVQANITMASDSPYAFSQQGNDFVISVHSGKRAVATQLQLISNIQFLVGDAGEGILRIQLPNANIQAQIQQQDRIITVTVPGVAISQNWATSMNVKAFNTPVQTVTGQNAATSASFVLQTSESYQLETAQVGNWLNVMVQSKQKAIASAQDSQYTGKRISLNFQDIPVRSVIQIIAEFTGINMVTSDAVQGNVSLRLNNVPWDQALDIVLKSRGLAQRRVGNVIYIGPAAEITAQEQAALQEQQQSNALSPLQEEYFHLGYAVAKQLAGVLQNANGGFLSGRGSVTVDDRTNTLLVRDTAMQLSKIRQLVDSLDVPVQQVSIEARIVAVDKRAIQDLGVTSLPAMAPSTAPFSTTTTSGSSNSTQPFTPAATSGNQSGQPVNAGAAGFINNGLADASGALGLSLSGLPGGFNLNLELQALEVEGEGKVISSPSLTVADKQEAYIQQGSEIPYQASTSSGASVTQFKKAVLSLRVTPQITPDGNIVLKLAVSNDSPTDQSVQGVPVLSTAEIQTQVLVKNGQTIVLGGIQIETKNHQVRSIPFLGSIPGIGWLFKSTHDNDRVQQLLIFLTPRIINGKVELS
jgi:type IV pilus assembly protein PilQ